MRLEGQDFERLRWRCIRRGLLEIDLMLTRFLDGGYQQLSDEEAGAFSELVDLDDPELWDRIAGRKPCSDVLQQRVIDKLRGYQQ